MTSLMFFSLCFRCQAREFDNLRRFWGVTRTGSLSGGVFEQGNVLLYFMLKRVGFRLNFVVGNDLLLTFIAQVSFWVAGILKVLEW